MKNLLGLDDAFASDIEAQQSERNPKNKKRGHKTKKGKKGNWVFCCLTYNKNSSSSSSYEDRSKY